MESFPDSPESLPRDESLPASDADDVDDAESLPASVDDGAELVSMVMPVPGSALPEERKESLPSTADCCGQNCLLRIETECVAELNDLQTLKGKLTNDDFNEFIFKLLLCMRGVGPRSAQNRFRYMLFGKNICRQGFEMSLRISRTRISRLLQWLKNGHMDPPRDLRH